MKSDSEVQTDFGFVREYLTSDGFAFGRLPLAVAFLGIFTPRTAFDGLSSGDLV